MKSHLIIECKSCIKELALEVNFDPVTGIDPNSVRNKAYDHGWYYGRSCYCPDCLKTVPSHCGSCDHCGVNKEKNDLICGLDGSGTIPTGYCDSHLLLTTRPAAKNTVAPTTSTSVSDPKTDMHQRIRKFQQLRQLNDIIGVVNKVLFVVWTIVDFFVALMMMAVFFQSGADGITTVFFKMWPYMAPLLVIAFSIWANNKFEDYTFRLAHEIEERYGLSYWKLTAYKLPPV